MKVLKVYSDGDYGALEFENKYLGASVKTIIENIDDYRQDVGESYEADFLLDSYDFGDICPKFVSFLKNQIIDEDDQKHMTFYLETEIV